MIGLIITACLAASATCTAADPRTCLRTRTCEEYFEPIVIEQIPTQQECQRYGMMYLAKPDGWLDKHPEMQLKGWRCGEMVHFQRKGEIEL